MSDVRIALAFSINHGGSIITYVINDTSCCEFDYNHKTKKIKRKSLMNTLHEKVGNVSSKLSQFDYSVSLLNTIHWNPQRPNRDFPSDIRIPPKSFFIKTVNSFWNSSHLFFPFLTWNSWEFLISRYGSKVAHTEHCFPFTENPFDLFRDNIKPHYFEKILFSFKNMLSVLWVPDLCYPYAGWNCMFTFGL